MIPRKFEPVLFGLVLSGLMSLVVSGVSAAVARGVDPGFTSLWARSWLIAWMLAFPTVLLVGPLARRLVQAVLRPEPAAGADTRPAVTSPPVPMPSEGKS